MEVDFFAARDVQSGDVEVEAYAGEEDFKYGFVVSRTENGCYKIISSTPPIYTSEEKALIRGREFVEKARNLNLSGNPNLAGVVNRESMSVLNIQN